MVHRPAAAVVVVTLMLAAAPPGASRQAPTTPAEHAVDLAVPMAPAVVNVGGIPHLVYELHVTNLRREPVVLSRVAIGDEAGREVLTLDAQVLSRAVLQPGVTVEPERRTTIEPNRRAVVYVWQPWPADGPPRLRHRLTLSLPQGGVLDVRGPAMAVSLRPAIAFDPPLAGGPWIAVYDPLLMGGHRTTLIAVDGTARISARFAVDWIRAPANGRVATVNQAPDWNGAGADVLAVADARVVRARDGMTDLPPGQMKPERPVSLADGSGNHVVLDLGAGRFAVYEHLQQGSVAVTVGQAVRGGQAIARLGSSGSTSIGPHLHFHVADAGDTLAAEGVPFVLRRFEVLGVYPTLDGMLRGEPWTSVGRSSARRDEHPAAVAVVLF